MDASSPDLLKLLQELNAIGIALSAEQDHNRLLEMILVRAKEITHADGGTLYSRTEDDHLKFEIMLTESLGIAMGGTSGEPIPYAPLPLYDEEGRPNNQMVAACAALSGKTINIPDAYVNEEFDFSGTRKFDEQTGYRSKSFLTVPMTNHENDIIGVLQLLNARDPKTGDVKTFSRLHQQLVESLASQAAVTITNKSLIDAQRKLFDSLIQLIANAIDEKSPYTAGHCRRVPVLVEMLADAACRMNVGPLKNFDLTDDERYELSVAAWLHDCGKITTPEYVVDKPTKLSTPFDRIDLVATRLEVLKRDAEITALRRKLSEAEGDKTKADLSDDEEYQALLIPLVIGVLQLLNARDPKTGDVKTFSRLHQQLVESLASQAAVTITNKSLIDAQRKLFDSLIQLIANAIDEKSPYTAGHCRRVPVLVEMLADAACRMNVGPLKNFDLTDDERYELSVAAWLHDCGKITTPEYVVDKPTKLSTPFDRIDLVATRLEVLKRDAEITALRRKLSEAEGDKTKADLSDDEEYQALLKQLDEDFAFLRRCNIGGESMLDEDRERVTQIGQYRWANSNGDEITFLNDDEIYNLHISRGTLTEEEREIINNHVVVTIKMLESLPYPKHLKRVPEYAGGHHERMDGTGYPNRLTKDDMSIPARMVAIADVFEALTARDRPYKSAMSLSEALVIMGRMKQSHHIDADLFDVFVRERVYARYAEQYLEPREIDDVDLNKIPGYSPSKNEQSA